MTEHVDEKRSILNENGIRYIISMGILQTINLVAFLIISGTMNFSRGGVYFILAFLDLFVGIFIFIKIIPELANQRGTLFKRENKWEIIWEKLFLPVQISIFIIAGLDTGKLQNIMGSIWTTISNFSESIWLISSIFLGIESFTTEIGMILFKPWSLGLGILLFILGNAISKWSMLSNTHFESIVRIQSERNHSVISNGPYRFVRHPGYLGFIIFYLSIPLIIGSKVAVYPVLVMVGLFITLTFFEDRFLKNKLDGYQQYCKKVRFRLLPGIW